MIVTEHYGELSDGTELVRTYSDEGKYIHKIGTPEIYEEAIDRVPVLYEYEETDELIPIPEEDAEPTEGEVDDTPLHHGGEEM